VETVKIPPKFQAVIPSKVRERLDTRPGQRVRMILDDNRLERASRGRKRGDA